MMPDQGTNDAEITAVEPRQHPPDSTTVKPRTWTRLLALQSADQPVAALVLLLLVLAFGGWYLWRATTPPGLIEIDSTEPQNSKLVVNVNTADAAELMLLPEIGVKTANFIVEDRLANDLFRNAKDFEVRIPQIGKIKLAKLVPHLEGWTDEAKSK